MELAPYVKGRGVVKQRNLSTRRKQKQEKGQSKIEEAEEGVPKEKPSFATA